MTETAQHAGQLGHGLGRGVRLPRTARRAQLLAAAQDVFVANGYHAAAMDEIADRAGVSKPVLYQHFPSKLELYLALLDTQVEQLVGRVRDAIDSTHDNKLRVRAAVTAYYGFISGTGQAFRLVFESDLRSEPAVQAVLERATSAAIDAITETITADAGLDENHARLLAVGVVGLSEVTARFWLDADQPVPMEDAISLISTLAWRGIGGFPLQNPPEHPGT
jgi:AcrR family transcriptional regulator